MEWFKKHADTTADIRALVVAVWWMTSSLSILEVKMHNEISEIKTELAVIKTVLIMKQIMPCELAKAPTENLKHVEKQ